MKIRFELTSRENNAAKNFVNKYAPCDTEIVVKDETVETKIGTMSATNTNEAPVFEVDLKEDFVIDCLKFTDECSQTLMGAVSILKPFCENFTKKLKTSFSKWRTDEWEVVAKGIAKRTEGNFIMGLVQGEEWVNVNERTKKLNKVYWHRPITCVQNIDEVGIEAANKHAEFRYIRSIDGKVEISDSFVDAYDWAHEMGIDCDPKHLAKEETTNE